MSRNASLRNAATDEERWAILDGRRAARMDRVDALPPATRECVQHYGFAVVNMLLELGITQPRHIRHIVETILDEFSPTRGTKSAQGIRAAPAAKVTADGERQP